MRQYEYIVDDFAAGLALLDLDHDKLIGFDTETTGLDPLEWNTALRLVQLAGREKAYVFDIFKLGHEGKDDLRRFFEREDKIFLAHNLKFDLKFIRVFLGVRRFRKGIDTMLAGQLLSQGILDIPVGLEACVKRYLNIELDKSEQRSDWSRDPLTPLQIQYAARDADILLDLWPVMSQKLVEQGQMYAAQIEFDCVDGVAGIELAGFRLVEDRWRTLCEEINVEWHRQRRELQSMLAYVPQGNGHQGTLFGAETRLINLDSPKQLIEALEAHGIPVPIDDKTGRKTTAKHKMSGLALQYPVANYLRLYRQLEKLRSSYGPDWLGFINPLTGRIHADLHIIGALTGRMSESNPNLQQVPTDKRYRRCFMADPGRKLTIGDYEQFELRILADYSLDPAMIEAFESGVDFHTLTASRIYSKMMSEVGEGTKERSNAKNNNFASVYGAGIQRFALMAGITLAEAEIIMELDRKAFPVKHRWLDDAGNEAIRTHHCRTRSGRLVRFIFDPSDKASIGHAKRHGKNTPIQGTNADVTKRAIKLVNDELQGNSDTRIVHVVHDELILETPADPRETRRASEMLNDLMPQAGRQFVKNVPVKVSIKVSDEWSK